MRTRTLIIGVILATTMTASVSHAQTASLSLGYFGGHNANGPTDISASSSHTAQTIGEADLESREGIGGPLQVSSTIFALSVNLGPHIHTDMLKGQCVNGYAETIGYIGGLDTDTGSLCHH